MVYATNSPAAPLGPELQSSGECSDRVHPLPLPHTVVFIVGVGRRVFIAELTEPLTQFAFATGEVRVSRQRVACRYFVETCEIPVWPPAKAYWALHGICDSDAAERHAGESDGVHFSFSTQSTQ